MKPVFVQVTSTFDDEAAALVLGEDAVHARLAACAQVKGPITLVFRWEGEVHLEREWRLVLKTRPAFADQLVLHVRALHAHDVVAPIISASQEYVAWATGGAYESESWPS